MLQWIQDPSVGLWLICKRLSGGYRECVPRGCFGLRSQVEVTCAVDPSPREGGWGEVLAGVEGT